METKNRLQHSIGLQYALSNANKIRLNHRLVVLRIDEMGLFVRLYAADLIFTIRNCVGKFHTLHVVNVFEHKSSTEFMFDWKKAKRYNPLGFITFLWPAYCSFSQTTGGIFRFVLSRLLFVWRFCCFHSFSFGHFVWYIQNCILT